MSEFVRESPGCKTMSTARSHDVGSVELQSLLLLCLRTRCLYMQCIEVRKTTKIRNQYIQVLHLTSIPHGKVTKSQLDITNMSQEASPFPAGDHKAAINRRESMTYTRHK